MVCTKAKQWFGWGPEEKTIKDVFRHKSKSKSPRHKKQKPSKWGARAAVAELWEGSQPFCCLQKLQCRTVRNSCIWCRCRCRCRSRSTQPCQTMPNCFAWATWIIAVFGSAWCMMNASGRSQRVSSVDPIRHAVRFAFMADIRGPGIDIDVRASGRASTKLEPD